MALIADRPFTFAGRPHQRGEPVRGVNGEVPVGKLYGHMIGRGLMQHDAGEDAPASPVDYTRQAYGQPTPESVVIWAEDEHADLIGATEAEAAAALEEPEPSGESDPKIVPPVTERRSPRRASKE